MSPEVTFEFYTEAAGVETTWHVTADVTRENGRYFAAITGAYPEEAREYPSLYSVADLTAALSYEGDGRTLKDVEQAAIDALPSEGE